MFLTELCGYLVCRGLAAVHSRTVFIDAAELDLGKNRIQLRISWRRAMNLIQQLSHNSTVMLDESTNSFGVELAATDPKAPRKLLGGVEEGLR